MKLVNDDYLTVGDVLKAIIESLQNRELAEGDADTIIEADKKYEVEIITRGNCMMCGKELDEGLFFCKECEGKVEGENKK